MFPKARNFWSSNSFAAALLWSLLVILVTGCSCLPPAFVLWWPMAQHCPGFVGLLSVTTAVLGLGSLCWTWVVARRRARFNNPEYSDSLEVELLRNGGWNESEVVVAARGQTYWTGSRVCVGIGSITLLVFVVISVLLLAVGVSQTRDVLDRVKASGLDGEVSIELEEGTAILHVHASSAHDLYYAQGLASAHLRLWQLEFQRRVGSGTLSELVGDAGLDIDKEMRTLGLRDAANRSFSELLPETIYALEAYADGVNAYLDAHPPLPLEMRLFALFEGAPTTLSPWSPIDSLVWAKVMSLDLSGNLNRELERFRLISEAGVPPSRVEELQPLYDDSDPYFPIALSPEAVCGSPDDAAGLPDPVQHNCTNPPNLDGWLELWKHRVATEAENPPVEAGRRGFELLRRRGAGASNNWVISGNRTDTGKPRLANDPHLLLMAPSIWILVHLHGPNTNVIGASFAGVPGVVIGRNEHVAWGVTNTGVDIQDLYVLNVTADGSGYWHNNSITPFERRVERIEVAGQDAHQIEVRVAPHYGPVITDNSVAQFMNADADGSFNDATLALRWVTIDPTVPDSTIDAFVGLSRATNWSSFREALARYVAPAQNFVFASTDGDWGYQLPGILPIRARGHSGLFPVPGNGSYDWRGFLGWEQLPHAVNPRGQDFVVTANNRIVPPCFAHLLTCEWDEGSDGFRAGRISEMLSESAPVTLERMKAIQLDYRSNEFLWFKPLLDDLCAPLPNVELDADALDACRTLLGWDGNARVGSREAVLWGALRSRLVTMGAQEVRADSWDNAVFLKRAFSAALAEVAGRGTAAVRCGPMYQTSEACVGFMARALGDARRLVRDNDELQKHGWGEGRVHAACFAHQVLDGLSITKCVGNREIEHGGDDSSVNVGHIFDFNVDRKAKDPFTQKLGPSYRELVDLADTASSVFMNGLGQSGAQLSKHYDNLLEDWSAGRYAAMRTSGHYAVEQRWSFGS